MSKFDAKLAAQQLATLTNRKVLVKLTGSNDGLSDDELAALYIRTLKVKSQGDYVAALINCTIPEGIELRASVVTDAMKVVFPTAKIGDRHGPHYFCLARKGKLRGLREDVGVIPHVKRKRSSASPKEDPSVKLREELVQLKRPALVKRAKNEGVKANGKSTEIIQRIIDKAAS